MPDLAYRCPLCQQPLEINQNSLQCQNRHSFDYAKEGYVNLLPVNRKKSKDPGDSKEMMQARRLFLDEGHYAPLAERLAQLIAELTPESLLDLGCGEGYYTRQLAAHVDSSYGMDISRNAVRYAAKRDKEIHFSVASAFDLPFADESFDLISRIYAPSKAEEIARCLKPGGHLLTVTPASHHLFELKQKIYAEPRLHPFKPEQVPGLEPISQEQLTIPLVLERNESLQALLMMTPFAWKLSEEMRAELLDGLPCHVTLDFQIQLLKKV